VNPIAQTDPGNCMVVVLTGGIASGKTTVSDLFARLGVPVIDTDLIAREVVQPGEAALQQISELFGPQFIDQNGQLDRRRMREAIFKDPSRKQKLEALLHPLIRERVQLRISEVQQPYCILVVPLLAETGFYRGAHRVLVVDVSEETQLERVMRRDNISRAQAESILQAQSSREQRLNLADDIIENSSNVSDLESKVRELHLKYQKIAEKFTKSDHQD